MGIVRQSMWLVLLAAMSAEANATDFTASILGDGGKPLPNAVITLVSGSGAGLPAPSSRIGDAVVDQREETFHPLVTIIPKGGHVKFANNDPTTHQVYSFSKTKQFELTLPRGESSSIAFETPGIAALGCNIHDRMIAYVFVAESPYTALTDENGEAVIKNVPPGKYRAQVWHPQQKPGSTVPANDVALSGDATRWDATMKVLPPRKTRSHGGNY